MLIRIEVDAPVASETLVSATVEAPRRVAAVLPSAPPTEPIVTATELSEWRRAILRILDRLDGGSKQVGTKSPAARMSDLSYAEKIPRHIAAMMRTVTEMRNLSEYQTDRIPADESAAVRASWNAVRRWADAQSSTR